LYRSFLKRLIDLLLSMLGFLFLLPISVPLGIMLFCVNRGRVFFLQARPGLHSQIFYIIKFKTMRDAYNSKGELLPDSERLTKIGQFIRKTSLDEIPQLLNVIKGDMSLIGPRPLLVEYLTLYNSEQSKRHNVKPGITGWAQVNGRNAITWEQKFKYDVWYVNNLSLMLDIKIIWMTLIKVINSEGISQQGHVTMNKFEGNKI
jgi:undecaprenyl phosphate N,N'-diacetylbacillosamine 1-phosphate transferase